MCIPLCAALLLAAIVYVQYAKYAKKREGFTLTPSCKELFDQWSTQGPDNYTPVCGNAATATDATQCKPDEARGCKGEYKYGYCPGTLKYDSGKCVPPSFQK
jgi:hypothetical protein